MTSILIALNIAIFVIGLVNEEQKWFFLEHFSLFAPYTLAGEFWRLLTATFVHGGPGHIAMNMFTLWYLGSVAENLFGTKRYLAIYLLAGILGFGLSLLSKILLPENFLSPSVGASGAIFGVAGALLGHLWLQARSREEFLQNPFVRNVGMNLVILIAIGAFGVFGLRIDNYAHVGGLFAGAALAVLLRPARALPKASPEKRRLSALILVLLGLVTAYSLYPVGSPGFERHQVEEAFDRGVSAFQAERFAEARDAFQEVIQRDPLYIPAKYNLALSYINLGENTNALGVLKELEALLSERPSLETGKIKVENVRDLRLKLEEALLHTPKEKE